LTFSRQGEQQKLLINLKPVIKETIGFLRASLPASIQLRYYLKPDAGTIIADPTQIQQVLMNLCTNAWHAMQDRGGVLRIDLDNVVVAEEDGQLNPELETGRYVKINVSDSGHGIEPSIRERIFDPYFTTKGPGQGTGLGLSVVHGIVKSHGGFIKVYSETEKGTTFQIFLPRADGLEDSTPKSEQELPKGQEKILFVDDEVMIANLGKKMLERLGYQIEIRTGPIEALELFRANPDRFDAIISDMTMPQMNGLVLAQEIWAIRPNIPIILSTGFSDEANEARARSVGIHAFLFKPILLSEIANTVRKVIDENKFSGNIFQV
jgi:CheY-like chemotaxis protein